MAIGGEEYMIEPIKGHPNASADDADQLFGQHQREHPHLIYKRSALNAADEKMDEDDGHGTCGNDGLSVFLQHFSKFPSMDRALFVDIIASVL